MFTKYPLFPARQQEALVEIFGEKRGKSIIMKGAEDGSGYVFSLSSSADLRSRLSVANMCGCRVGAALIAAITARREENGVVQGR